MTKDEFYQEHFHEMTFEVRDRMLDFSKGNQGKFITFFQESVETYIQMVKKGQESGDIPTLESIQISFLHTSFFEKKFCFQIHSYDEAGSMIGTKYSTHQVSSFSFGTILDDLQKDWNEKIKEAHQEKVITASDVESWFLSMLSPILRFFISRYRYELKELWEQPALIALSVTENFFVNLGQLDGWKKMIFGLRPDRDLAIQDKNSLWNFTSYEDKIYKNEVFDGLHIKWGHFKNCTFEHCEIKNFSWLDCHFHHCTFHAVKFADGSFWGSMWKQSVFLKCEFVLVDFYQTEEKQLESLDRYRPCEMELCHMSGILFYMCRLEEMKLPQTTVTNTEITISGISDSDFNNLV